MLQIGIDTGLLGAMCFVEYDEKLDKIKKYICIDMPTLKTQDKKQLDTKTFVKFITEEIHKTKTLNIAIEDILVLSSNAGNKTIGTNFGKMMGIIEVLQLENKINLEIIRPAIWKKYFKLGKNKKDSVELAEEILNKNNIKEDFYTKRGRMLDGRAEAFLIAYYKLKQKRIYK